MILYHFVPAEHAFTNIRKRRIKIAELDKLNDPFELLCSSQRTDRALRAQMRRWKAAMAQEYGMLCFSENWENPLLWSHYADRHRGICLGVEVRDDTVWPVEYAEHRTEMIRPFNEDSAKQQLFTKFIDWQYEQEWRAWAPLKDRDPKTKLCFADFDDKMQLRSVVVGPL